MSIQNVVRVAPVRGQAAAFIMGRRMCDEGELGRPDPPPFRADVRMLTHPPRHPWGGQGGSTFAFVATRIESACAQARQAAGAGGRT